MRSITQKYKEGNLVKKSIKKAVKIAVKKYTEITDATQTNGLEFNESRYITNEGGKQYIVEVWA
jgi:CRISPR/Cas system CSM-associated protein Csm4 (group 5 of RAMP superfamily)